MTVAVLPSFFYRAQRRVANLPYGATACKPLNRNRSAGRSGEPGLERGEVGPDAGGVDAEIALPLARQRAHVDAAAAAVPGHADDHVVGEAHPEAALARPESAGFFVEGDIDPARHGLRRGERARESFVRRQIADHRLNVGIGLELLPGHFGP